LLILVPVESKDATSCQRKLQCSPHQAPSRFCDENSHNHMLISTKNLGTFPWLSYRYWTLEWTAYA